MATLFINPQCSPPLPPKKSRVKHPFRQCARIPFSHSLRPNYVRPLKSSTKDDQGDEPTSSSTVAVVSERPGHEDGGTERTEPTGESEEEEREREKQQEMDWKSDEEFKRFMGSPSIEAAIKLEKKRADRKLKELDRQSSDNPIVGFFNRIARDSLAREKERLEKAGEVFKALDLNKVSEWKRLPLALDLGRSVSRFSEQRDLRIA